MIFGWMEGVWYGRVMEQVKLYLLDGFLLAGRFEDLLLGFIAKIMFCEWNPGYYAMYFSYGSSFYF